MQAAEGDHWPVINWLKKHHYVNLRSIDLVMVAAKKGDLKKMKDLLSNRYDLTSSTLFAAAKYGQIHVCTLYKLTLGSDWLLRVFFFFFFDFRYFNTFTRAIHTLVHCCIRLKALA